MTMPCPGCSTCISILRSDTLCSISYIAMAIWICRKLSRIARACSASLRLPSDSWLLFEVCSLFLVAFSWSISRLSSVLSCFNFVLSSLYDATVLSLASICFFSYSISLFASLYAVLIASGGSNLDSSASTIFFPFATHTSEELGCLAYAPTFGGLSTSCL